MSANGWTTVDVKQKKSEKKQQKSIERKEQQKQIEKERQKRKQEEERLSYSGWGPEESTPKKTRQQPGKGKKHQVADFNDESAFTATTIYMALQAAEEAKEKKDKAKRVAHERQATEAERAAQAEAEAKRKREKELKKKKKKPSLAQLSSNVDIATLRPFLAELSDKYPGKYDVQVKVLADFFESRLGKASLGPAKVFEEKTFARKLEIPYAYLEDEAVEALREWLAVVPQGVLVDFTQFLLSEVFRAERGHKTSGMGLRMLLAILARHFPDVMRASVEHASFTEKYLGDTPADYPAQQTVVMEEGTPLLRASYVPTLVWYFGQTIEDHPVLAFTLWARFLQPFLFLGAPEAITAPIFDYYDLVLAESGKNVRQAEPAAAALALERLSTYREGLTEGQLRKDRLNAHYQAIEAAVVWRNPAAGHHYLPVYLRHAASAHKNAREEAQKKVVRVLGTDKEAYKTWERLYPRHILASAHVLLFLAERWAKYVAAPGNAGGGLLDAADVAEVVRDIQACNERLAASNYRITTRESKRPVKVSSADVDASDAACRDVLNLAGAAVAASARASRARGGARGASASSSSSSSSSSLALGALLYVLLFVALVGAIAVLALRQAQPETYARLAQAANEYYLQGRVQAAHWTDIATERTQELSGQAQVLLRQLVARAHEFRASLAPSPSPAASS